MNEKVSVLMSVYNEDPPVLEEAIRSILKQTYPDLEFVIILDNPSNERLKAILQQYQQADSRIQLHINEQNVGLVQSLNRGLAFCTGRYIARMDADDISLPERLETQKRFLEEGGYDFIFSNVTYIGDQGNVIAETTSRELGERQLKKVLGNLNIANHPTWFIRKEVYEALQGYREIPYCEDYDFILRSLLQGYRVGKLNVSLLRYRLRSDGISNSNALNQFLNMRGLAKIYRKGKLHDQQAVEGMLERAKRRTSQKADHKYSVAAREFDKGVAAYQAGLPLKGAQSFLKASSISQFYLLKLFDLLKYRRVLKGLEIGAEG